MNDCGCAMSQRRVGKLMLILSLMLRWTVLWEYLVGSYLEHTWHSLRQTVVQSYMHN